MLFGSGAISPQSDVFPLRVFSFVKAKWRFSATLRKWRKETPQTQQRDWFRDNGPRIKGFNKNSPFNSLSSSYLVCTFAWSHNQERVCITPIAFAAQNGAAYSTQTAHRLNNTTWWMSKCLSWHVPVVSVSFGALIFKTDGIMYVSATKFSWWYFFYVSYAKNGMHEKPARAYPPPPPGINKMLFRPDSGCKNKILLELYIHGKPVHWL